MLWRTHLLEAHVFGRRCPAPKLSPPPLGAVVRQPVPNDLGLISGLGLDDFSDEGQVDPGRAPLFRLTILFQPLPLLVVRRGRKTRVLCFFCGLWVQAKRSYDIYGIANPRQPIF